MSESSAFHHTSSVATQAALSAFMTYAIYSFYYTQLRAYVNNYFPEKVQAPLATRITNRY